MRCQSWGFDNNISVGARCTCPKISGHMQYAPTKEFCSQGGPWEQDMCSVPTS